ncbi:hypothetical protein B0H11DRAFT_2392861 [Mycena galericulata]|nr:hypothetical protein B0H11DRAFT_2392861 [Mycena galericulata]
MPPRPPRDRDSAVHFEPLRASVLDVFAQLGAFDDDSGIVEWIFPEVHEEKELQRSRVKLPEVVDVPEPVPETPTRKSRASRFFGIRSRSKSRVKKEDAPATPTTQNKKPKKSRSTPDLRKDAEESGTVPEVPPISSPSKKTASPEQKSRRLSIFPRKGLTQSLDQPRPSISDEEWQQVTMTGSIADYENNPFLGMDPHGGNNDAKLVKRDGLQTRFSRFTSSLTRSTPTSPTHATSPNSGLPATTSDPATPTGRTTPTPATPDPTSPTTMHSNASTSTLPATAPAPSEPATIHTNTSASALPTPNPESPAIQEVPREDALETSSQMDHVRQSLSDISEGDVSESSTLSIKSSRDSHVSTEDTA